MSLRLAGNTFLASLTLDPHTLLFLPYYHLIMGGMALIEHDPTYGARLR